MPKFRNYQTNFSGGLLSEGMLGRVDLAQYENGCKQLENWWPKVTGGMRRRPGSISLADFSIWQATRIESFVFNEDQTYIIAFTPVTESTTEVKIYNPDTGSQVTGLHWAPLTATIISEMTVTQKGDVMFMAHTSMQTLKLTRTAADTFELAVYQFENYDNSLLPKHCPFIKFADFDVYMKASGHTGTVTLTCQEADGTLYPYFHDGHIGQRIQYRGKQLRITNVPGPLQPQSTCTAVVVEELDRGEVLGFNSANDAPNDFLVDEIIVGRDSGIKAQVIETSASSIAVSMIAGKFPSLASEQIEGLTSGNIATITSNSSVNPPPSADWAEEAFSDYYGWPSVIEFHSQRLWLGGSSSLPAHLFGSRVAAFFNFDVGDAFPADSIQVAISSNQINQITGIVSGRHLQVFTDSGEFYAPQSQDRPLVPETFDLLRQTRYGAKRNTAKVFDESTMFVQDKGTAIREFLWVDNQRGYSSDAVSLISEEYISDVAEVEVLYGGYDRPEQICFFVNGDGTITWYHAARAENIRSWGIWTTQGSFKSLTVLQDKLFALVERTIDGVTTWFLERFEMDVTVDCAVQATASAQSSWANVHDDLGSENVDVVVGVVAGDPDYYLGSFALSSGSLDVSPHQVDNVTVGLPFTQVLETMPIEVKDQNGVTGGMPKRIVSADVYMASTLAIQLEGHRVLTLQAENDLTQKPTPITGLRKFYLLGYSERPTLTVENEIPVPCEVLSLGGEVEY